MNPHWIQPPVIRWAAEALLLTAHTILVLGLVKILDRWTRKVR